MKRNVIYIIKEDFVHEVGLLLRLYCDARSAKQHNKIFVNHFPFSLQLWMYHAPLTWHEQQSLGHKARFEALLKALWVLRLFNLEVGQKGTACLSYRQVHVFTNPITQRFYLHLATA
jgi:hypothetical protein